ncbi:MAG: DUF1844 domain-containing protein [Myxococcota bacterium]
MAKRNSPEEEQESSFRVVDRRRFTEEGESRQGEDDQQNDNASATTQASQPIQSKETPSPSTSNAPSDAKQESSAPKQQQAQPLTFELFIQSLGQQAMMAMGLLPWPDSGLIKVDLQRSREMIDVIALLHEKTKGNLTPDEQKLCEALLYQLRVTFVQMMQKGSGQPPGSQPPPAGAKPPQTD